MREGGQRRKGGKRREGEQKNRWMFKRTESNIKKQKRRNEEITVITRRNRNRKRGRLLKLERELKSGGKKRDDEGVKDGEKECGRGWN